LFTVAGSTCPSSASACASSPVGACRVDVRGHGLAELGRVVLAQID
jgi:hypothetical protein